MPKTCDYMFKILLIGDKEVGKADVMLRFSERSCNTSTTGVDLLKSKTIDVDGKKVKLQMWDTAGLERFRTITTSYYSGAKGIMLVYDITNETSFENVRQWMKQVEKHAPSDVISIIVGNNCEMNDRRQVSKERGEQLATEYGVKFMEISHRRNINVDEAFFTLARDIKKKMDKKKEDEGQQSKGGGSQQSNEKHQQEKSFWKCTIH